LTEEFEIRRRIVAEAESWLGTKYHHMARLKGVGCDCLTLIAGVYEAAGITGHVDIPFYPPDWHLHRSTERYADGLAQYCRELVWEEGAPVPALAGDVVLFRFARCFSHGALVVDWPHMIHAWAQDRMVVRADADQGPFAGRPMRFFSPFSSRLV
jgi:NlpC/P60 family putative phage cell wall peptidase